MQAARDHMQEVKVILKLCLNTVLKQVFSTLGEELMLLDIFGSSVFSPV